MSTQVAAYLAAYWPKLLALALLWLLCAWAVRVESRHFNQDERDD